MKKITLFLFFIATNILMGQNVVEIAWGQGINESVASPTIEVGDTVLWIWNDGSQKSVTALPNGTETFP